MLWKIKISLNKFSNLSLSILSGILIFLSFPKFLVPQVNSILGFLMFVPLFLTIFNIKTHNSRSYKTFFFSFLSGIIGYCGIFYWIVPTFKVAGENQFLGIVGTVLLSYYCSLYLVIFCTGIKPEFNFLVILKFASLWVILETIRANIFSGFPWMLVGYTQYSFLYFIQLAEFGGVYIISFLVILVNLILANIIFFSIKNFKQYKFKIISNLFFIITIFFVVTIYGQKRISEINSKIYSSNTKLNIILLQGNIDQYKKWDTKYRNEILSSYSQLISDSIFQLSTFNSKNSTLYIWPESAIPGWLLEEYKLYDWLKELVIKTNSYHLVGTIFYDENKNEDKYYNGAILFNNEAEIIQKYSKIHLVPFGEYVPLRKFLAKYISTINELGEFTKGKEFTIFKISDYVSTPDNLNQTTNNGMTFSTLICYESIFPELTCKFVKNGAKFLVNITNDAWYLKTSAPYQLFIFNIFRAVENRTFVLRSANTGISGLISPTGEVLEKTKIFTTKYLIKKINLYHEQTFYTKNSHLLWLIYLGLYLVCRIFILQKKL